MCGIAGIVGSASPATLPQRIETMLRTMAHRGPDDAGQWIDPAGGCAIGHKRLSIIDPAGGHQPMTNEDQTLWITFNGCIYNHLDLARTLRQHGHRFATHCDTEVILHAYEQWGPACVEHLNGMWGFAIWDLRRGTLFCSRDRLGIKPLYYTWDGGTFAFASEIKALLAAGAVEASPDAKGLGEYLSFQFCLDDTTLFAGVHRLPPGHNLVLARGKDPQVSCWWDIDFGIDEAHDESYFVDRLNRLLEDAVRLRLRADVSLGAHLSGGLDSSTVVSLTRLLLGDAPIKTFTGAFDEGEAFDETRYARRVAREYDTDSHEIYLRPDDFAGSIERIIWHMDEPAAGPGVFPQFWVSKLAAEHVKVVLGGQGGDEIFIGYARYLVAYLEECLKGAIEDTADRGDYVATLATITPSLPYLEHYKPMLRTFWREGLFDVPARRYFRLMDRFADSQSLLADGCAVDTEAIFEAFRGIFDSHGAAAMINRILCFDLKTHLQSLLHVEDRTSMAWGLESRVPLLDYRLVELLAAIPPVIKFKHGQPKYLFRQAIRNLLPAAIRDRRDKMGFPVPLAGWMKGPLRDFAADILLSPTCRQRGIFSPKALSAALASEQPFGRSIWGALCLELWHRQFIDRTLDTETLRH